MWTHSKLVGVPDRQDEMLDGHRNPSLHGAVLVLKRQSPVTRPVDLALKLKSFGLRLREAHEILDLIVADQIVETSLVGADRSRMIAELAELGVSAR